MGMGTYSINGSTGEYDADVRTHRLSSVGIDYKKMSRSDIFKQKEIKNDMSPYDVEVRESRDSDEHPNSLAIVLGLDVTGSMGSIPHYLVQEGLPHIMGNIIERGIKDPQLLFFGIGDHQCDSAPLQVGQFESSDELLDKWLTDVWLEGGGGGNNGESYFLAWYFAGFKTSIDCHEKRKQKGFLFTVGDEPVLKTISKHTIKKIMGKGEYVDFDSTTLLDKAKESYHVYHLHLKQGLNGERQDVMNGWKELMGDNLIIIENKEDVSKVISEIVTNSVTVKETIEINSGDIEEIL